MKFPDASGVPANMLPISDGSAFDQLKPLVDSEGANLADPDWLGMLAAIGIVKGQPFNPDPQTREILDRAAKTAYKMSRVIGFRGGRQRPLLSASIQTAAGSIPLPTGRPQIRAGRWTWPGAAPTAVSRSRRPHLVLHRLLLDQSRDDLANAGQGRQIHDRLHRQRRHAPLGRQQLSPATCRLTFRPRTSGR